MTATTSLAQKLAKCSPSSLRTRFSEWRTARREAQMNRWEEMERNRIKWAGYAAKEERSAKALAGSECFREAAEKYSDAAWSWRFAWQNINPLTPDVKGTRRQYEERVYSCDGFEHENDNNARRADRTENTRLPYRVSAK